MALNQLVVPDWVPDSVHHEAHRLHAKALAQGETDHAALIVRLARSEPMRWVWNEMTKKHPTGKFVHPASLGDPWTETFRSERRLASRIRAEGNEEEAHLLEINTAIAEQYMLDSWSQPMDAVTAQNIAIAHFFMRAFCLAVYGSAMVTTEQVERGLKPLREAAHHFRRGADKLRAVGLEESVPEAERIATRCEIRAARLALDDDDPALVQRHRRDGDVRWYCRSLATTNVSIFGKSLVGTVRTVASVAFDREVRHRSVQEWCAGFCG